MSQPSVACYFNTRKRSAVEETKISRAKKVLVLDCNNTGVKVHTGFEDAKAVIISNVKSHDSLTVKKAQNKNEVVTSKKIEFASLSEKTATKKVVRKIKKEKILPGQPDLHQFLKNMNKNNECQRKATEASAETIECEKHITPPNSPVKKINAMDKISQKADGPSISELKRKMTRSGRLAELKASLGRFKEGAAKLKEIEKKTSQIPDSPKLKDFKTIELEVQSSPQKILSPEKAYLSPKKDASVRRNLLHLMSPTKNAVAVGFVSPSKQILDETSKPSLTLPYKYRYLAEMFRSIDTVAQILYNRKETITYRKLKPAVEEMLKRNLTERHIAQIKHIYPDAFNYSQEKMRIFGAGNKQEQWELVLVPIVEGEHFTAEQLLQRRRKLFNTLLDKVKDYHNEFLLSLDQPMQIAKDRITRWHPEFDIERIPDIELVEIPQPPMEEKLTTGKDVLEKARQMFNCNSRMEQALERLKAAKETAKPTIEEKPKEPTSILKGIPKALLEKVRQKQAAKALISMTRSADKEKEVLLYSRLPELARLTRNLFVSEKKGVLPLDTVVDKLGNCYRSYLTRTEMEEHLTVISKEVPGWLVFHEIRHTVYIKLAKNADVSIVINKLENLAKQKNES